MTVIWHHEHHAHEQKRVPGKRAMVGYILAALLVLILLCGGGWFLGFGWQHQRLPVFVEQHAWIPLGRVSGHFLWYRDVVRLAHGIAATDEREVLNETDYFQAIDTRIRQLTLIDLAKKFEVDTQMRPEDDVTWTPEIRDFLHRATWSEHEYEEYIQQSFIVANRVEEVVLESDEYQQEARATLEGLREKLLLGIAFADVAHEYSEDPSTAQARGSFGYVSVDEVDEAFVPVFLLDIGEVSDILATHDAYWLVTVEDRVQDRDRERVFLRGIAVKKRTLAEILEDVMSDMEPVLWVN